MINNKLISKIVYATLFFLNIACVLFLAISPAVSGGSASSHAFAIIMTLILILDIVYAALMKRKWGSFQLAFIAVCILLSYLCNLITSTVTPAFPLSISIIGLLFNGAVFISSAAFTVLDFFGVVDRVVKRKKQYRITLKVLSVISVCFILGMMILSSTFISISTNMILSSLAFNLSFMVICFGAMFMRIQFKDLRTDALVKSLVNNWATVAAITVLCVFSAIVFLLPTFAIGSSIKNTNLSYEAAFGDIHKAETKDMRKTPFSLADVYTAIPTGYHKEFRNIPYYTGIDEDDKDTTLSFDVYTPIDKTNVPAIVFFHGYGVDKYEVVGKLRYFAEQGYVVYGVQYGTPGERYVKGKAIRNGSFIKSLGYAAKFLNFAKQPQNNTFGADWSRVFIMGNSYGGAIATITGLLPGNGYDDLETGLTYKGIIPIYPGISPVDINEPLYNGYDLVNENSAPMLMFMGTNDGVVYNATPAFFENAYDKTAKGKFALIHGKFMTHAGDYILGGAGNQLILYYAERFLATFS